MNHFLYCDFSYLVLARIPRHRPCGADSYATAYYRSATMKNNKWRKQGKRRKKPNQCEISNIIGHHRYMSKYKYM